MKKFAVFIVIGFSLVLAAALLPRSSQPAGINGPQNSAPVTSHAARGAAANQTNGDAGRTVQPPPATDIAAAASPLVREKIIDDQVTKDGKRFPLRIYRPMDLPNDPLADQWWVATAHLDTMWAVPAGEQPALLAVIDTGFGLEHEEFENRWYVNPGESGPAGEEAASKLNCTDRSLPLNQNCNLIDDDDDGIVDNETGAAVYENPSRLNCTDQGKPLAKDCNLTDDDGNGLVDDYRGWDFINFDNRPQAGELNPDGDGTRHGTMVAGVAAATGNNSKGIAGVDWAAKILPLQALDDDSHGNSVSVARSIRYAANQGADVISLSLGSDLPDPIVREAVLEAIAAGSIVVAASGNGGCACMVYPANYPEVVAVGALNEDNEPAWFSAWGANLDIVAPGVNFTTADWHKTNGLNSYAGEVSGTSFATPLVSGVLTRMLSHQPAASPLQLLAALTENTERFNLDLTTLRTDQLGFGGLHAQRAVSRLTTPLVSAQLWQFTPVSNGTRLKPDAETDAPLHFYQCPADRPAATPLFELSKNKLKLFSASYAERQRAVEAGYSASLLAYGCVLLPHDTPESIRHVNPFREFRNITDKTANP